MLLILVGPTHPMAPSTITGVSIPLHSCGKDLNNIADNIAIADELIGDCVIYHSPRPSFIQRKCTFLNFLHMDVLLIVPTPGLENCVT